MSDEKISKTAGCGMADAGQTDTGLAGIGASDVGLMDTMACLYQVVEGRKAQPQEGSYTCYLFEQGLDKILKKCGEECSETIIAAKNGENEDTASEICDLLYHLTVLMVEQGIPISQVNGILRKRAEKIGNLKQFHVTDRES